MKRKTVKGLVLETSNRHITLLTARGEFLKVSAAGGNYSPGTEVEVPLPRRFPYILTAACIAAALLIALVLSMMGPPTPEAYLALDMNPSIVFSLDKHAVVLEAEPFNAHGQRVLEDLEVKGAGILPVMDALLETARENNFLSPDRDNAILISLAAPENYSICKEQLFRSITNQLMALEVDTYLKVTLTGLEKVREAKERDIPLNALLLGEAMRETMQTEEGRSLLEGSPPLPVREFLNTVKPDKIFDLEEFIRGKGGKPEQVPKTEGEGSGEKPDGGKPVDLPELPAPATNRPPSL